MSTYHFSVPLDLLNKILDTFILTNPASTLLGPPRIIIMIMCRTIWCFVLRLCNSADYWHSYRSIEQNNVTFNTLEPTVLNIYCLTIVCRLYAVQ
jgi:hypothetical protein